MTGHRPAPEECDQRQAEDAREHRLPQGDQCGMAVHHDERIGACRRMNRFGEQHEDEREHFRQRIDPQRITKRLIAEDADQRPAQVTAEEGARLSGRRAREPEQECGRSAERSEQKRRDRGTGKPERQGDSCGGAKGAPEQPAQVAARL